MDARGKRHGALWHAKVPNEKKKATINAVSMYLTTRVTRTEESHHLNKTEK